MTETPAKRDPFEPMFELIKQERQAIAQLDSALLSTIAAEKMALVTDLQIWLRNDAEHDQKTAECARRLKAESEANALLMRDALEIVSEILGQETGDIVYDRSGAARGRDLKYRSHRI